MIFFAREGKWDAHLLSFAISARNVPTTKNYLKGFVQKGGGDVS